MNNRSPGGSKNRSVDVVGPFVHRIACIPPPSPTPAGYITHIHTCFVSRGDGREPVALSVPPPSLSLLHPLPPTPSQSLATPYPIPWLCICKISNEFFFNTGVTGDKRRQKGKEIFYVTFDLQDNEHKPYRKGVAVVSSINTPPYTRDDLKRKRHKHKHKQNETHTVALAPAAPAPAAAAYSLRVGIGCGRIR